MADEQGQFSRELDLGTVPEGEVLATNQVEDGEEEQNQELQNEILAEEEQVQEANELEALRQGESESIQLQAREVRDLGTSFSGSSAVKWGVVFTLAILNDVVDLLDLTGFGAILAWIISLGLTATIILILWFFDGEVKRANRVLADLGQPQQTSGQTGLQNDFRSKFKGGVAYLSQKREAVTNKTLTALRGGNPMTKILIGSAIETIPYIDLINLVIVWAVLAYFDERRTYRNVRIAAEESSNQLLTSAAEMV